MKPILFLKNIAIEGPGTFETILQDRGVPYHIQEAYNDRGEMSALTPSDYAAVISLGGPMNADEDEPYPFLIAEKTFLRASVDRRVPTLGICLGAQLLARALGASVSKNPESEIGWMTVDLTEDGRRSALFANLPNPLTVFQWHGDAFDVPPNAKRLAESPVCANQAFSMNDLAFGLQFHVEVTERDASAWAREYAPSMTGLEQAKAQALLDRPDATSAATVKRHAVQIMDNFLDRIVYRSLG